MMVFRSAYCRQRCSILPSRILTVVVVLSGSCPSWTDPHVTVLHGPGFLSKVQSKRVEGFQLSEVDAGRRLSEEVEFHIIPLCTGSGTAYCPCIGNMNFTFVLKCKIDHAEGLGKRKEAPAKGHTAFQELIDVLGNSFDLCSLVGCAEYSWKTSQNWAATRALSHVHVSGTVMQPSLNLCRLPLSGSLQPLRRTVKETSGSRQRGMTTVRPCVKVRVTSALLYKTWDGGVPTCTFF